MSEAEFDLFSVPALPYAGTSGWSGSDTSRERARVDDVSGTTTARQEAVLEFLDVQGANGATWSEIASEYGWHHGQASNVLSVLHKVGLIARLKERRNKSAIYVALPFVLGREVAVRRKKIHVCTNCGFAEEL